MWPQVRLPTCYRRSSQVTCTRTDTLLCLLGQVKCWEGSGSALIFKKGRLGSRNANMAPKFIRIFNRYIFPFRRYASYILLILLACIYKMLYTVHIQYISLSTVLNQMIRMFSACKFDQLYSETTLPQIVLNDLQRTRLPCGCMIWLLPPPLSSASCLSFSVFLCVAGRAY